MRPKIFDLSLREQLNKPSPAWKANRQSQAKAKTAPATLIFFMADFVAKKRGKWNSLTTAVYPVNQQLQFAHGRLRLKLLMQIWQRSDLCPSIFIRFGAQKTAEESASRKINASGMLC